MSDHGAALQTYNQELVKCLEDLKMRRLDLQEVINREELEKNTLESNVKALLEKLAVVNKTLSHHIAIRDNYDQTIKETEIGFKKILESSQMLLNLAQHEANRLDNGVHQKNKSGTNGLMDHKLCPKS